MKFSVVCMNPPYLSKQMVYLKFLKKAQDCSEQVLGLHPAIPFLDQRSKNRWTDLITTFSKELDYIRVINSKKSFVDVDIQSILCITHFKDNSNGLVYENDLTGIKTVLPHNNPDLYTNHLGYNDLWNRFWLLQEEDSILKWKIPKKHKLTDGFVVELSLVRGNIHKDGNRKFFKPDIFSYNPSYMEPKPAAETQSSNKNKFWFKTKWEAEQFCKYLNTPFARGILGISKRDYNPKYSKTPAIDLTKPFTNASLYTTFSLTQAEIDFIDWILSK